MNKSFYSLFGFQPDKLENVIPCQLQMNNLCNERSFNVVHVKDFREIIQKYRMKPAALIALDKKKMCSIYGVINYAIDNTNSSVNILHSTSLVHSSLPTMCTETQVSMFQKRDWKKVFMIICKIRMTLLLRSESHVTHVGLSFF